MYIGIRVKCPLFMSGFSETRSLSTDCRKTFNISNFMKMCPVGTELFHAEGGRDGRTDMTKLIVCAHNFVNAPNTR